jgi:hypothetical protein
VSGVRGDKPGKVRHAAMGLAHIASTEEGQRQLVNFRDDDGNSTYPKPVNHALMNLCMIGANVALDAVLSCLSYDDAPSQR